jgi:hypothetical protein
MKRDAKRNRRSLNAQMIHVIEKEAGQRPLHPAGPRSALDDAVAPKAASRIGTTLAGCVRKTALIIQGRRESS